jgi:hypothetical protein
LRIQAIVVPKKQDRLALRELPGQMAGLADGEDRVEAGVECLGAGGAGLDGAPDTQVVGEAPRSATTSTMASVVISLTGTGATPPSSPPMSNGRSGSAPARTAHATDGMPVASDWR